MTKLMPLNTPCGLISALLDASSKKNVCINHVMIIRNSLLMLCWLVINLTQTRVTWEGNASIPLDRLPSSVWSVGMSREYFLDWWLIWKDSAHCGWYWPKARGSWLCKTAGWTRHEKQVSKVYPSVTSTSVSASRFYLEFLGFSYEGLSLVS